MRFVTQMVNQGGTAMITDLRSFSWEEGNGKRFRFNSSQYRDEKATEITAGDAARANTDDVKVELTKPAKKDLSLPARVYFPVQHSIALLAAAKAARRFFAPISTTARRRARRCTTPSPSSARAGRRAATSGCRR
jgi:hypothetical protein